MTTSMSTLVTTSGGAYKSLTNQQFKNLQPAGPNSSADALVNSSILSQVKDIGREQDLRGKSMVSSTLNPKSDGSTLTLPKQGVRTEGWSPSESGLISFDSLVNPPQRVSYISSKSYESILNHNDPETEDQDPPRQFTDDWPNDLGSRALIGWPEELKSDCTQLSMSIPVVSTDFLSSSSSPTQEKCILSPLRLSHKSDPIQIGSGARGDHGESSQNLSNWIPISWGTSMGNPLGEVLTTSTGSMGSCKNSSALNLSTEGWDDSPQLGSSPTGVLQKATFISLSNSSSGSARTESKNNNG
uniref:Growth-regulating factor 1-like n=1 Tax=Rhizophora mucronata TaxID=61149 RepID=A0A2P2P1T3_RHIMU